MTNEEKENLFFDFVKQHQLLSHIVYGDTPVEGQQWIGIISDNDTHADWVAENVMTDSDAVIIDPNWDEIRTNFENSAGKWDESKDYMMAKMEALDTPLKGTNFIKKFILEKMKSNNIQAKKVYVGITSHWAKSYFDSTVEA